MTASIPTDTATAVTLPGSEFFAPATIEPLFWRPRFIAQSPMLTHAPFLFWLVNVVRPRAVSVLGVGDGVGHFVLCQALDKLNLPGRCEGHGFWAETPADGEPSGDEPAAVPPELAAHEARFYDGLSFLHAHAASDQALQGIRPDSLDLLFVDLDRIADPVPEYDEWLARLKPDGILVLHGVNGLARHPGQEALARWLEDCARVEFPAGRGVAAVTQGSQPPHRLRTLMEICERGIVPADIDRIFRRLGQGLESLAGEAPLQARLDSMHQEIAAQKAVLRQTEKLLAQTREAHEQRNHKLAEFQSRVFDAEQGLTEARLLADLSARDTAIAEARAEAELRIAAIREAGEKQVAAERQVRFNETAILTRRLEEDRAAGDRQAAESAGLRKEMAQLQKNLAQLQKNNEKQAAENIRLREKNRKLENHVKELLNSTSWRITAPMRKVKTAFRR